MKFCGVLTVFNCCKIFFTSSFLSSNWPKLVKMFSIKAWNHFSWVSDGPKGVGLLQVEPSFCFESFQDSCQIFKNPSRYWKILKNTLRSFQDYAVSLKGLQGIPLRFSKISQGCENRDASTQFNFKLWKTHDYFRKFGRKISVNYLSIKELKLARQYFVHARKQKSSWNRTFPVFGVNSFYVRFEEPQLMDKSQMTIAGVGNR